MSETQSSRRNFLKTLGLTGAATIAGTGAFAGFDQEEILKLNPAQQEFMLIYGEWMDDFINVIRIQKTEPDNVENHGKMMVLSAQAEEWKPQLTEFMKDKTFALIYQGSIERMSKEI